MTANYYPPTSRTLARPRKAAVPSVYPSVKIDNSNIMNMSKSTQSEVNDKIIENLNEMLAAENAAIDRLESRIEECLLPEGNQQLHNHLEETRQHQQRLRKIVSEAGGNPTDSKASLPILTAGRVIGKKTLTNMAKSIKGQAETNPMHEEVELVRIKEDYGIEHVEILSYRMIIQLCQRLGLSNAIPLLAQSLQEEESMARWIETNAPTTLDRLWPRVEAAVRGIDMDQANPIGDIRTEAV